MAAALIRAGFTLELEDETDRRSTHVEFVATHTATGAKYSVEAKRREGAKLKLNKLLHSALTKRADHPRMVFIDTNDGRLDMHKFEQVPLPLAEARQQLNLYSMDPISRGLPPAYVVATWAPEEHHLESAGVPYGAMLLGFCIDDLAPGYRTLLEQVQIQRRHGPVFELLHSIEKHRAIPATFDGEASAFARGAPPDRLKVGEAYEVTDPDGRAVTGLLESGVVMNRERVAWCIFRLGDGRRILSTVPLTDIELQAYKEHPATFFGTVDRNAGRKQLKTGMDAFEFMWGSYKGTPKELLLDWMKSAPDLEWLASLPQEEVATHYCVRMAQNMMRDIDRRAAEAKAARERPTA